MLFASLTIVQKRRSVLRVSWRPGSPRPPRERPYRRHLEGLRIRFCVVLATAGSDHQICSPSFRRPSICSAVHAMDIMDAMDAIRYAVAAVTVIDAAA